MRNDLADITLVVDRSGSMWSCKDDAQGGINTLIKEQAKQPGDALITLVQFDTVYDIVFNGVPVKNVPEYNLTPRGGTALLDAVGRAINETGARLAALPEDQRPALVMFVIATDGHENASMEFTKEKIKEMTEHQQTKYNWQFTYLGANQDAFTEASNLGISQVGVANYAPQNVKTAYGATSDKLTRMRSASLEGKAVDNSYTDEEKKRLMS
jgi:uncharacterized protein YegL